MGLFDLFRKKKTQEDARPETFIAEERVQSTVLPTPEPAVVVPPAPQPEQQPEPVVTTPSQPEQQTQTTAPEKEMYVGDLQKTDALFHLVNVPREQRDGQWQHAFIQNLAGASFRCGNPQVVTGPDGFPYFQLFLPEPNTSFECYVIDKMKDDFLLREGFGVVINPNDKQADWVLTYGDILNLKLTGQFYTMGETPFSREGQNEVLKEQEEVMVGNPSEAVLSAEARKVLGNYLKLNGIANPKVLMMMRRKKDGEGVTQDLVFNATPEQFESPDAFKAVMSALSWYLPNHYAYVGMDEQTLGDGFVAL